MKNITVMGEINGTDVKAEFIRALVFLALKYDFTAMFIDGKLFAEEDNEKNPFTKQEAFVHYWPRAVLAYELLHKRPRISVGVRNFFNE